MAGLTDLGFTALSQEEIEANLKADLRAKIGPTIDLEPDSPNGQVTSIYARQLATLWEAAQAVANQFDPDQATGKSLTQVAALTGTQREDAQPSTFTLDFNPVTVNVDPGTYAIGTLVASVAGDPTARFSNALSVVNGGGSAADIDAAFTCETTGPVRANSGTLTVIAAAVAGWNSVTNALDANLGRDVELDEISNAGIGLRLRRAQDLARRGSTTADAILADLDNVDGVTSVSVLSNDTDSTDVNGLPPHSVEAIVLGGTDVDVATAVFQNKSAGTATHGTSSAIVTDSQGVDHTVYFSRPTDLPIYIIIELTARRKSYVGDAVVLDTLANLYQAVGGDVIYNRLIRAVMDLGGLKDDPDADITVLQIGTTPSPVSTTNIVVTARQLASFDTSNISLSSSLLG